MTRRVQIAPVGFEYDRIIEGVFFHPCNIIYLLKSYKEIVDERDPDKEMVERANGFVIKLKSHFEKTKICEPIVKEAILIELEPTIRELCTIVKDEIENNKAEEIWINISTSTKLFASAAMYVGSFMHDIVHLFYIDASHYTVNDLFDPNYDKQQVLERYENFGITYKKNEESYKNIEVPVYPTEVLSDHKKKILKTLRHLTGEEWYKKITFKNLLMALNEDPDNKSIKMRYSHHINKLKARNLLDDEYHGKQRRFILTHEGHLLGLILQYFE